MIENYRNGNLTDAKRGAKRLKAENIMLTLQDDYNFSADAAHAVTAFLKGNGTFQAACDAEYRQTHAGNRP